MKFTHKALHLAIALTLLAGAVTVLPAHAGTVTATGTRGVSGIRGATGNPGGRGTDGTAGANALAVANDGSATNIATATGGTGGSGGPGGNKSSSSATPGTGGNGGAGGAASATAITVAAGNVLAQATARGGNSGALGDAGGIYTPTLPRSLYGDTSSGGTAFAQAFATSTTGGNATAIANQIGGSGKNGTDSIMNNQVGGSTTGVLTLEQAAVAGSSLAGLYALNEEPGGKAQSTLWLEDHLASAVNVNIRSSGGIGARPGSGNGGNAQTTLNLMATGAINAQTSANGGKANATTEAQWATGGAATVTTRVYNTGLGADVTVDSNAIGGDVGNLQVVAARSTPSGHGGDASSDAFGSGSGKVTVKSSAIGGIGGEGNSSLGIPKGSTGSAVAQATAVGTGSGAVTSQATAETQRWTQPGGNARANATAFSSGGGDILALSQTHGQDTESHATGGTQKQTGPVRGVNVAANSAGTDASNTLAVARIGSSTTLSTDPNYVPGFPAMENSVFLNSSAIGVGAPADDVVRSVMRDTPDISQRFIADDREVLGVGMLRGQKVGTQNSISSSIDYQLDTSAFSLDLDHLMLGFNVSSIKGWNPTTSYVFDIKLDGLSIFHQTYSNSISASGQVVDLGDWETLSGHKSLLDLQFSLTALTGPINLNDSAYTSLFVNFVFGNSPTTAPVPVPAAGWLLGSGLLTLVAARRRRQ